MTTIRSPVAERSINPSWVVKADTASSGDQFAYKESAGGDKGGVRRWSVLILG